MATELQGCAITERDSNNEVLVAWIYPTLPAPLRRVALASLPPAANANEPATPTSAAPTAAACGRAANCFYYSVLVTKTDGTPFSLLLWSSEYHKDKYTSLATLMATQYTAANGDATTILGLFLAAFVRGKLPKKVWTADSFPHALDAAPIKELWSTFNLETIVLYVAVLLKRRVALIAPDADRVVRLLEATAALAPHRKDTSILFPNIDINDEEEIATLPKGSYVIGSTDGALESRSHLYDVVANARTGAITVSPQAVEDFALGRVHKNIATEMLEMLKQTSSSDADLMKEMSRQTQELLGALDKLSSTDEAGNRSVTMDAIQARKMPASMHRFLINLATAENLLSA